GPLKIPCPHGHVRAMLPDQIPQTARDLQKTPLEGPFRTGPYDARRHHAMTSAIAFDDPVPGALAAAVDSQNAQWTYEIASSSFSSISKLEYVFCTSSCSSS